MSSVVVHIHMPTKDSPRTVQAVENVLNIIDVLEEKTEAGITEIADELDRSKGTIHSHLVTLLENEYVVKSDDAYQLSLKFLELGESVTNEIAGFDIIKQEIDELAEKSGELGQVATQEHGRAVYLYKSGGSNAVQTASSPGKREHLHCISLGKAMLAHMPEERIEEIIEQHGLPAYTENTITTRDELMEELSNVRERGYAFDREERIDGIRCVAAPIQNNDDTFGAVSVSGPSTRMQGEFYNEELPDMVTRSANVIELNTKFA